MATVSKRKSPARATSAGKPVKKPSATDARPFLRFYHSEALRKKTLSVLCTVERAEDPTAHRAALADLAVELTNTGMDYFFMQPLKLAKAGFIIQQSANIGLAGAKQVMGSVIRNIIGRMGDSQLLSVCGSIRRLML